MWLVDVCFGKHDGFSNKKWNVLPLPTPYKYLICGYIPLKLANVYFLFLTFTPDLQ